MPADPNEPCARDGCNFLPMLVPVRDWLLPAVHCSHACGDFVWLERTLAAAPVVDATPAAVEAMERLRQLLDARQEPTDVGPLVTF
ncbi:hypothetical protein AB0O51_05685 [Streptomyces sp. NPDC090301]|uniref:hypothetical protein n=1 Tax=Streptomyces sp. NPDC090301 TaxID=3154975 RepID=UPI0034213468